VYPLLAVLQSLVAARAVEIKNDVRYVGRAGSIEERLAAQAGIPFVPLRVAGLHTLSPGTLARNLSLMVGAETQVRRLVRKFKPQAVLATGGYVSAPAIWAAARTQVPVVIYLPDLEPGWAIRTLARWAECVAVSFDEVLAHFPPGKAVVTGYPVRAEFQHATRAEGRARFKLDPEQNVLTVFGGSQGAHSINEAVRAHLSDLLELTQIIHISGRQDEAMLQGHCATLGAEQAARYRLYGYVDEEMPLALAAADLVVARAGAATLGEFPTIGVPSILIPYPFAGKHQEKNADFLVSHGAAVKLDDARLGLELAPTVTRLLRDRAQLERMTAAARALAKPDAAGNIANLLKRAAG
jgi:UDP-N-acetylglucosamine--N-acetylmuramyl-(pentapeptide) pyrophosphoryl-undecaprenol N-acetylglucosamine transferase